jgi:hypothetical protein
MSVLLMRSLLAEGASLDSSTEGLEVGSADGPGGTVGDGDGEGTPLGDGAIDGILEGISNGNLEGNSDGTGTRRERGLLLATELDGENVGDHVDGAPVGRPVGDADDDGV